MASSATNLTFEVSHAKIFWNKVRQVVVTEDAPASHIKTFYTDQTQQLDINRWKRLSGGAVGACQVKLKRGMIKPRVTELNKQDLVGLCNSDQIFTSNRMFSSLSPTETICNAEPTHRRYSVMCSKLPY